MALDQYGCVFCSLFITNAGVTMQLFNALYITLDDNAQVPALGAPANCLLLDSTFWSTACSMGSTLRNPVLCVHWLRS